MKQNNYIILQTIIMMLGIIGTTSLSFFFVNNLVYIFSMTVFGIYNLLQIIHFSLRRLWLMVILFLYFLVIGLYGYINFIIQNKELLLSLISKF